jgi:hypothetical protein
LVYVIGHSCMRFLSGGSDLTRSVLWRGKLGVLLSRMVALVVGESGVCRVGA